MSEYAEQILEGFACEGCGKPMGDHAEPGYPRKCRDCRKGARREREKSQRERDPNGPFICKSDAGLCALRYWLQERPPFNAQRVSKGHGAYSIQIGMEKTTGELKQFFEAGLILCSDAVMRGAAEKIVAKAINRRATNEGREP